MIIGAVTAMQTGTGDALVFRGGKFGEYSQWPSPAPTENARQHRQPDNEVRSNP
jgi:hypothetical protein